MYDYLAKIILLGPSGAGKYVSLPFSFYSDEIVLTSAPADHVYCIVSLRMNVRPPYPHHATFSPEPNEAQGASSLRRPSA